MASKRTGKPDPYEAFCRNVPSKYKLYPFGAPKPWKRNFAIRSVGRVTREDVEKYIASQFHHHRMADSNVQSRLEQLRISRPHVDLSRPQWTSHGLFWHNLHMVLVHRERLPDVREHTLSCVRDMVLRACDSKGFLLSEGTILSDHVHLAQGCPFDSSPADIAIGFLINLSYVYGMKDVYQYGAFIGTFGEYSNCAMK